MSKRVFIVCCLLTVLLIAGYFAQLRSDVANITLMAQAENEGYTISVKRWQDSGHHSNRYKRLGDRFRTELLYLGRFPVSSYEFDGTVPITNAVIAWTKLEEFSVTFDHSVTVRCTWDDHRAFWERR